MRKTHLAEAISIAFIILFVYAATSKLIEFQKFRIEIGKSPLLTAFSGWIAIFVPSLEILISFLLASARWRLLGLYASFSLMTMFSMYIFIILHFSAYIPCSCGGILQNMTWTQHLIFNLVFIVLAVIAALTYYPESKLKWQKVGNKIPGAAENLLTE